MSIELLYLLHADEETVRETILEMVEENVHVPTEQRLKMLEAAMLQKNLDTMRMSIALNAMDERMRGPVRVRFKLLSEHARVPTYAKPGDAGADLYIARLPDEGESTQVLFPNHTMLAWSDVAIELPEGYEAQVRPRSSTNKRGLLIGIGTVDSGYRGSIGLTITNVSPYAQDVNVGDKLAQLVIHQVPRVEFERVDELSSSERGTGGFGSSDRPTGNGG